MRTFITSAKQWATQHPSILIGGFLAIAAMLGWPLHDTFGVSQDEPAVLTFGMNQLLYLIGEGPIPAVPDWRFYNPIAQIMTAAIVYAFNIENIRTVWETSHYVTFLVFLTGVGATMVLAKRMTASVWWALLAGMWMLCTPRLLSHAFVNPKDIPALAAVALSMLTLARALEYPTSTRLIVHALATAVSISIRTSGLLVAVLTVALLLPDLMNLRKRSSALRNMGLYAAASAVWLYALWPALWADPVGGLLTAITDNTSRGVGLPWHYVPVWMAITIPVVYSLFFAVGAPMALYGSARSPKRMLEQHPIAVLSLVWFFAPVVAQIVFDIGIFNEWRHLLFIYPGFVLLAVWGAWRLSQQSRRWSAACLCILALGTLLPTVWMWAHQGFWQTYFSVPTRWTGHQGAVDY